MTRTKKHKDHLNEVLQDPEMAAEYINVAAEEGDLKYFLVAVRNVADAHGGMTWLANETGLNRESLYTTLSEDGNPTLDGLNKILKALGVCLRIAPPSKKKNLSNKETSPKTSSTRSVSVKRAKIASKTASKTEKDKVNRQKI